MARQNCVAAGDMLARHVLLLQVKLGAPLLAAPRTVVFDLRRQSEEAAEAPRAGGHEEHEGHRLEEEGSLLAKPGHCASSWAAVV